MEFFFAVIGMVMILEGVPYFLAPDRMKRFLMQILEVEDRQLRGMGLVLMAVGLFIVTMARR